METRLSLEPRRALARFVALLTGGDIDRRPDDAIRLDALGLGPITPLLGGAPEEAHPDLGEMCAPFRAAGEVPSNILLLALAEAITGPRPLELRERALFHRIASLLGMRVAEATEILKLASRGHAAVDAGSDPHVLDARRLLGVGANATADAVDAAYLARVARFDPAAAVQLGGGAVAFAVRWLSEFTLARETLLASCGPDEHRRSERACGGGALADQAAATVKPLRRRVEGACMA